MNSSYSTHRWNQYGWFCAYPYIRGIFSLLVAVISLALSLAGAPPEFPSTPAGKVLAGYLEALNSGNKDKLEAFVKAHRPDRPDALDRMLDLRWNTGGFDLYSIESSQALNIQAVVREREGNGRYNRMSVSVRDAEPAVTAGLVLPRFGWLPRDRSPQSRSRSGHPTVRPYTARANSDTISVYHAQPPLTSLACSNGSASRSTHHAASVA